MLGNHIYDNDDIIDDIYVMMVSLMVISIMETCGFTKYIKENSTWSDGNDGNDGNVSNVSNVGNVGNGGNENTSSPTCK